MDKPYRAFIKKYWWILALLAIALSGIVYVAARHDFNPVSLLREYGYYVILVWTFLEGETVVIIAGIFAKTLELNPWLIALAAFCGSFTSDQVMFSLGKYKGQAVLQYFPKLGKNLVKVAALFKKYDTVLILGFRFVYGVRNITPIFLGISGVSHKKFFFLNLIGAGVWALTFSFGGFYAGKAFAHVMDKIGHGIFFTILAVLVGAGLVWYIRSRRAVRQAAEICRCGAGQDGQPECTCQKGPEETGSSEERNQENP